ncbi:MAG: N-terminal phage integrase SAM-like domain-containing protein [Actinomycetota bacterium]|nr:N-terminal phage integrase SAM-like domain-containing protein [Actinomycetota bacterium]
MPAKAARRARDRGLVRKRGNSFQVIVYAGVDPVTGKDNYLSESTLKEKDVEKIRTRLLAEVDRQRSVSTKANLGYVLDAWLAVHEVDPSTLLSYRRTVEKRIKPALGQVAAAKITPRRLEEFYAELRRCRQRCDGRPFVEHRTSSPHGCDAADRSTRRTCRTHVCRPYAPATIRETHVIISGALSAAVRWGWLTSNPADNTKKPRLPKPQPDPPSPADAARIAEAAWGQDED